MELTHWGWRGKVWEEAKRGKWEEGKCCWKFWGRNENEIREFAMVITPAWLWFDNALVRGTQSHFIYHICHWVSVFNFWKHQNLVSVFHHPNSKFWVFEWWKQLSKTKPNTLSSVGPTRFGWWIMKTEWYHSVLVLSKQALNASSPPRTCPACPCFVQVSPTSKRGWGGDRELLI